MASDTSTALLRQCLHQAEAPCGVASPHGLHRQDFVGKDVLIVINNSFLGNEKSKFFTNRYPTKGIISYFITAR